MPQDDVVIGVRVRDDATRALGALAGRVRSTLLSPLTLVGNAARGILKQFFDLKKLLLGGGIIGLAAQGVRSLSANADTFSAAFSPETQQRIDSIATALNRLGASFQAIFGRAIAELPIDEWLDSLSDWLRDSAPKIPELFAEAKVQAAEFAKVLKDVASVFGTIAGWIGKLNGSGSTGGGVTNALMNQPRQFPWERAGLAPGADMRAIAEAAARRDMEAERFYRPPSGDDQGAAARDAANLASARRQALEIIRKTNAELPPLTENFEETARATRAWMREMDASTEIVRDYLTVGEAASLVTDGIVDAFDGLVRGTLSVSQAFGQMVTSILADLGRLLLQRSLFNLLTSLGGSLFGAVGSRSIPGSSSSGAFLDGAFPQLALGGKAMGGYAQGLVTVGERGPETVYLPRGSRVTPSHRRGGDGGGAVTVNVYGARDPQATTADLLRAMRTDPAARRALGRA